MNSATGIDLTASELHVVRVAPAAPVRDQIRALLSEIPHLYPGFDRWLRHRLVDASRGRASCSVVAADGRVVGVTLSTPKSPVRYKLSTIYVAPDYRERGIGRLLLEQQVRQWHQAGARNYYLTVREDRAEPLARLCWNVGLQPIAIERDRYGAGQHEVVLAKRGIPTWVALF